MYNIWGLNFFWKVLLKIVYENVIFFEVYNVLGFLCCCEKILCNKINVVRKGFVWFICFFDYSLL